MDLNSRCCPPDNATGNFTKVTQRVPIQILLDDGQKLPEHLRAGLSVIATVRTKAGATPSTGATE
ncbi:MAG: hypothetical protein WDO18_19890 [Acidobacteriota bacterium]